MESASKPVQPSGEKPHSAQGSPPSGSAIISPAAVDPAALDPCKIDRVPADRLVRSTVFLAAAADYHPPTLKDALQPVRSKAAATKSDANDMEQRYLLAALSRRLPENVATAMLPMQEIGYLFLEQVRLRPIGATIGDLVYTLALGPRERVVLTQKTWTKRFVSLEDVVSESAETEIEFSSAFSTEIGESVEHQQQAQESTNVSASVSGGFGPVTASIGYGSNASAASNVTAQRSSRQTREQTRKATDRAKKEHRVTFKLETESGVEDVSQRTFENPNTSHSLMLNFFRIFQRFRVTHERWGVRACWSPCVQDPGRDVRGTPDSPSGITAEEKTYLEATQTWMPPDMPPAPVAENRISNFSAKVHSGAFGYRDDVSTQIDIPAGMVLVSLEPTRDPGMNWGTVDVPWKHSNPGPGATGQQTVWWHIGLADCNIFEGCSEPWGMVATTFTFTPSSDAVTAWTNLLREKREAEFQRRLKEINDAIAQRSKGLPPERFDPWTELMRRVVAERLTPDRYSSCTEVGLWRRAFEWEAASYEIFPRWWNGHQPDGDQSTPTSFLNASWARLYIPIVPGFEMTAFQLVYGNELGNLQQFVDDLESFRQTSFGTPGDEHVIQVAGWEELMPTDGTYVEPVIGGCLASDADLAAQMTAERKLLEAQASALLAGTKGKDK